MPCIVIYVCSAVFGFQTAARAGAGQQTGRAGGRGRKALRPAAVAQLALISMLHAGNFLWTLFDHPHWVDQIEMLQKERETERGRKWEKDRETDRQTRRQSLESSIHCCPRCVHCFQSFDDKRANYKSRYVYTQTHKGKVPQTKAGNVDSIFYARAVQSVTSKANKSRLVRFGQHFRLD